MIAAVLFVKRNMPANRWPLAAVVVGICFLVVFLPWVTRNEIQMGRPIFLRSDFGLELAIAFLPGATTETNPITAFRERIAESFILMQLAPVSVT